MTTVIARNSVCIAIGQDSEYNRESNTMWRNTIWMNSSQVARQTKVKFGKLDFSVARSQMRDLVYGNDVEGLPYSNIFSLSIIPLDPNTVQPIYYQNSFKEVESSSLRTRPNTNASMTTTPENAIATPLFRKGPLVRGFMSPYPSFISSAVSSEATPNSLLPGTLVYQNVSERDDLNSFTQTIISSSLKERIKKVIEWFLKDNNAKGIYMVVMQPEAQRENKITRMLFMRA